MAAKPKKPARYLTDLRITRIATVDAGDNPRADIVLWKRRPVAKDYGSELQLPKTTDEIIVERNTWQLWCTAKYAFTDSLSSILAGAPTEDRLALLQKSVREFVARVKSILPEATAKAVVEKLGPLAELDNAEQFAKRATLLTDEAETTAAEMLKLTEGTMATIAKQNPEPAPAAGAAIDVTKLDAALRPQVEALIKRATDAEAALAASEKTKTDGASLVAAETKRADALQAEVTRLKAEAGETEDPLAHVEPEIRKRIEETEGKIAKMEEKEAISAFEKTLGSFNLVGTTPTKAAGLLHRIEKGKATADDVKEIVRLLKSAGELARKGTAEIGRTGAESGEGADLTAFERATEAAKALVADGKAKSISLAMPLVWKAHPEWRKEHYTEKRAGAR